MSKKVNEHKKIENFENANFVVPETAGIRKSSKQAVLDMIKNDPWKDLLQQNTFLNSKAKENSRRPYQIASTFDKMVQFHELGLDIITRKKHGSIIWDKIVSGGTQKDHTAHMLAYSSPKLIFNDPELDKELRILIFFTNSFNCYQQATLNLVLFNKITGSVINAGAVLYSATYKHNGKNIEKKLETSIDSIVDVIKDKVLPFVKGLKTTQLSHKDKMEFAKKMFELRLGIYDLPETATELQKEKMKEKRDRIVSMEYEKLLVSHKELELNPSTLWNVMQRIFENLQLHEQEVKDVKGRKFDVSYKILGKDPESGKEVIKSRKLSSLSSMTTLVHLNESLIKLAQSYWEKNRLA